MSRSPLHSNTPLRHGHLAISRFALTLVLCVASAGFAAGAEPVSFENDIRPIFKAYCLDCHGGGEKLEGQLDLRLARFTVRGGDTGAGVVVGKPAESYLIERLKSGEMPLGETKVPPEQIAVIEQWIAEGAKSNRIEPETLPPGIDITPEDRAYWAFQPLTRPEPPAVSAPADRVRTPVDAFILARLRAQGLDFQPDADRQALIFRAALDLTGLPPTKAEIEQFVADTSPTAYEQMIDRYLASPHYGERWARHWLDVAGYADSEGNGNDDTPRPYAYKYRDYVIRSLNADKPLNQFLIEQLAGDELVPQPWTNLQADQIEILAATGFLKLGADPTATGAPDEAAASNQTVADSIKIVSSALLGMSVGCAQCHDHRYDPIPQTDYFRFRAIFAPALDTSHWRRPGQRLVSLYTDADRQKAAEVEQAAQALQGPYNEKLKMFLTAALEKELEKFPEEMRGPLRDAYNAPEAQRTPEQKQLLDKNPSVKISAGVLYQYNQAAADELKKDQEVISKKRAEKPVEDYVSIVNELPGVVPATHLFYRGDHKDPRQAVTPGDLTIAAPDGQRFEIAENDPSLPTTGRRLAYARHLTSGKHPLLGRVLANRFWLHHFGRTFVQTPGEFGRLGTKPTHPELLDYLATELAATNWSLKQFHRLVMLSTVYRQGSQHTAAQDAVDSENALYGRFPVQRLDAETLRDRVLAVTGRIDLTQFGKPVAVSEDFVGQVLPAGDSARRSLYLEVKRSKPVSFLTTFDSPVMTLNCDRRQASVSAPQSLMLLNSDFIVQSARVLAEKVRNETPAEFEREATLPIAVRYPRAGGEWQFGFGTYDESTKRVSGFAHLPHFTGSAWQGGPTLPDPTTNWVLLHAIGGHAGQDAAHMTIRRFVAPRSMRVSVQGKFKHAGTCGDGVRGRVVSSREGLLGEWSAMTNVLPTEIPAIELEPGDTLDFVVDCQGDVNCDSFEWPVQIVTIPREPGQAARSWASQSGLHGPRAANLPQLVSALWQRAYQRPVSAEEMEAACQFVSEQLDQLQSQNAEGDRELAALAHLCQQLLISNEFLHVD